MLEALEQHIGALTLIIAVATVLLALFANLQWLEARRSAQRQLRAYLSVTIGSAVYQERDKDLKFAAHPKLMNNGSTPAYKVRVWARAEVIPEALVENYNFQTTPTPERSQASIGPKEDRIITAIVPAFVNDADVADIKLGKGRALWVWGTVHYEDAFGKPRFVNFSQRLFWLPDGTVMGLYGQRFGDSN